MLFYLIFSSIAAFVCGYTLAKSKNKNIAYVLAKATNIGILFIDKNGKVGFVNKHFEAIFNLKPKEIYKLNKSSLSSILTQIKPALDKQKSLEFSLGDKTYQATPVKLLIKGEAGGGFVLLISDISKQKHLQDLALKRQILLQESKDIKNIHEILKSIAHQQKQPLTAAFLLLDEIDENPIQSELLTGQIRNLLSILSKNIDDFSGFYSHTEGFKLIDLAEFLSDFSRVLSPFLSRYNIKLSLNLKPAKIKTKPDWLRQILLSLVLNAKDELKNGGEISIFLSQDKAQTCISVKDNGKGIDKKIEQKIYQKNFSTKPNGSGFGLYMSSILADKLGATLRLDDSLNGAKFDIIFKA